MVLVVEGTTCFGCVYEVIEAASDLVRRRGEEAQAQLVVTGKGAESWRGKMPTGVNVLILPQLDRATLPLDGLPQLLVFSPKGKLLRAEVVPRAGSGCYSLDRYFLVEGS